MTPPARTHASKPVSVADPLRAILEESPGALRLRNGRQLAEVRRSRGEYASSCAIEDVELVFADGSAASLVLKHFVPHPLLPETARVKPAFLIDPRREIETYRLVLGPYDVGAPAMIGAAADEEADGYLLLLEKAEGIPLWQSGDVEAWRAAARWQAAAHARLAKDAGALAGPARLLHYDADYYARWRRRAQDALASAPNPTDARRLFRGYEAAIPRLLELPRTFIHGEFHASNVLADSLPGGVKITPIDWEMAALGPALMDLADLTAGKWTAGERQAMTDAYRDALGAHGSPVPEEFARELDDCRLHRAVQWLSWSPDWSPPPEHRQDWLGEALRACDSIDALAR